MMKDLCKEFQSILQKHGASKETVKNVNVTRLKQAILADIPELFEEKNGKFTLLTSREPLGDMICGFSSAKTEGEILFRAAKIIRKYMFKNDESFDGDLSKERQLRTVPQHLLQLLDLILESNESEVSQTTRNFSLKIAQLIRFNSVKTKRSGTNFRHSKKNELPFPVAIGLSIHHSKTRNKSLIEELSSHGLCISYDRVVEIEDNIEIILPLCQK